MFHIISRPPFDDFSFNLYKQMYLRRNEFGLKDSEFMYTWTGYMSLENGFTFKMHPFTFIKNDDMIEFFSKRYELLMGDNKYTHSVDELYGSFVEEFGDTCRTEFVDACNKIHLNLLDRKQTEQRIQDIVENKDKIVIFVKDHFRVSVDNSWVSMNTELGTYFKNLFEFYPNKEFILVTSLENLDKEINSPNVTIIPMGGDITNQCDRYQDYTFVTDKEYANVFCSYNRNKRNHRTYLISKLYSLGLEKYGDITYLGVNDKSNLDLDSTLTESFDKFLRDKQKEDDYEIYGNNPNDNLTNYNSSLSIKYQKTFVEFVADTSYNEYGFNITEKFLHSVNGSNLPIIVSSPGYVSTLREMGFDMFDDVINHAYDNEIDKITRLEKLIQDNIELISSDKAVKLYEQHKTRFYKNRMAVSKITDFYSNRFWERLKKI